MTISVSFEEKNLVVMRGSDELKRLEADQAKRQICSHILENGKIFVLVFIEPGFTNLEAFASWDDIEEDTVIQKNVIRLAVVGDLRWRDTALLFFITAVASFQIEYFKADQEDFARSWLVL
ncbi:MAG: STAS/SEC14 domain-containing protein [Polaromonas sp.]|nr:STAS/SEC14 domain-containing protein [Polaromonas sp.]